MKKYVLDACGLIAFLRKEEGSEVVRGILGEASRGNVIIYLHAATLVEIYYDFIKGSNVVTANNTLTAISELPIINIVTIELDLIKQMGYFKTNYKTSFADLFVLATAKLHNATIITSDHHEFDLIATNGDIKFHWIR